MGEACALAPRRERVRTVCPQRHRAPAGNAHPLPGARPSRPDRVDVCSVGSPDVILRFCAFPICCPSNPALSKRLILPITSFTQDGLARSGGPGHNSKRRGAYHHTFWSGSPGPPEPPRLQKSASACLQTKTRNLQQNVETHASVYPHLVQNGPSRSRPGAIPEPYRNQLGTTWSQLGTNPRTNPEPTRNHLELYQNQPEPTQN